MSMYIVGSHALTWEKPIELNGIYFGVNMNGLGLQVSRFLQRLENVGQNTFP